MGYANPAATVRAVMRNLRSVKHGRLRAELTATRKAKGIAQYVLSAKLGRSPSYVSKYESGERRLEVLEFIAVCEALGVDPAAVLKKVTG